MQKEVPPLHKLLDHAYKSQNPSKLKGSWAVLQKLLKLFWVFQLRLAKTKYIRI